MMSSEKQPMQADGTGSKPNEANHSPSATRPDVEENSGESGGGAYPHPKNNLDASQEENSFMGHGGQSDMRYYGSHQLGSEETGDEHNATTKDGD
jgi:hypothetical protein